jgi:hypothetical protein
MTTTTIAAVTNLRETRRQMAEASKRHPATAKPAKRTPAKRAAKAAPTKPAVQSPKLRWRLDGEKDEKGRAAAHADAGEMQYAITGTGDSWRAAVLRNGKVEQLAAGVSHGRAYAACMRHRKAQ